MGTDARNLSALAVMIEYAAIEAGLMNNKKLEFILLAALNEARHSLESSDQDHSSIHVSNELWQ